MAASRRPRPARNTATTTIGPADGVAGGGFERGFDRLVDHRQVGGGLGHEQIGHPAGGFTKQRCRGGLVPQGG